MNIAVTKLFMTGANDLALLMVFMVLGVLILQVIKPLQKFFLPASLIGGTIALLLGPQVLHVISLPKSWNGLPAPMINIVLTCAIFGVTLNRTTLKNYAAAINLEVLTYSGQMVVGVLTGMALSKIWPELPYCWGLMTVYTYWGGHGAGAAAGAVFENLGVPNMVSLGIVMATLGLVIAMVAGIPLVNYGVRKGWAKNLGDKTQQGGEGSLLLPKANRKPLVYGTVSSETISGLALQVGLIMLCMFVGRMIFSGLALVPVAGFARLMKMIPPLVYGIIGALLVWFIMCKTGTEEYADIKSVKAISGLALDVCVCAATATLNLKLFAAFLAPLAIHMVIIVALMIFLCVVLQKRWLKHDWFELSLLTFGQGLGSAPSGLALARCVDPDNKSTSWEGFGVASGVIAPISSTLAALMPIAAMESEWIPVVVGLVATIICLAIGETVIRKQA